MFGASAIGHITNFKSDVNYLASNVGTCAHIQAPPYEILLSFLLSLKKRANPSSLAALSKAYGFAMPATEILEGAFGIAIALLVLGTRQTALLYFEITLTSRLFL